MNKLLAVIVILGLLMAIAIPSVTKYITQSRKKTLISSIDSFVTALITIRPTITIEKSEVLNMK